MDEFLVESEDKTRIIRIDPRCHILRRGTENNEVNSTTVFLGYFQERIHVDEFWSEALKVAVKKVRILGIDTTATPAEKGKIQIKLAKEKRRERKNQRELSALLQLKHPNITKLLYYQDFEQFRYMVIIKIVYTIFLASTFFLFRYFALELCATSLHDYSTVPEVKNDIGLIDELTVILHLARALEYIHSKRLVHRNIHPKNVLIHYDGVIKLTDFECSKMASEGGSVSHSQDNPGGEAFRAPELFDDGEDDGVSEKKGYISSDVFSVGCVFFFFLGEGLINLFGAGTSIQANIINGNDVNSESIY